ncbi:hypothetical protein EJB05_38077, partial [Eragrostis curvula]
MNHATCRRGGNCRLGFAGAAIAPTLPRNRTLPPLPGEGLVGRPCPSCNETLRHQFVPGIMITKSSIKLMKWSECRLAVFPGDSELQQFSGLIPSILQELSINEKSSRMLIERACGGIIGCCSSWWRGQRGEWKLGWVRPPRAWDWGSRTFPPLA